MLEPQLDWTLILAVAAVVLFPVVVFVGVRVLRTIIIRRNPDIEA